MLVCGTEYPPRGYEGATGWAPRVPRGHPGAAWPVDKASARQTRPWFGGTPLSTRSSIQQPKTATAVQGEGLGIPCSG